jgi:hypothetical protein
MKKLVTLFVLLALTCSGSFAQNFIGKGMVGINGSQIDGDGLSGYNMPGLLVGAAAEFPLSSHITIQPEIQFSQKGARTSQKQMEQFVPFYRFRLNYIDVPVTFNYYVRDNFIVFGGPSFNYLFSASFEDPAGLVSDNKNDYFKDFEISAALGMEYRLLNNFGVFGRWNYTLPFYPINSIAFNTIQGNQITGFGFNAYNNLLSFGIHYSFKPNFKLADLKKE